MVYVFFSCQSEKLRLAKDAKGNKFQKVFSLNGGEKW